MAHLAAIASRDEPELGATVDSLLSSGADVLVVDDGGSASGLPVAVEVIRNAEPVGCGRARNQAAARFLEGAWDTFSVHDGHMNFPDGVVQAMATKARETDAVCITATTLWERPGHCGRRTRGWGTTLFWHPERGVDHKWRTKETRPVEEWGTTPGMIGAAYFMSRSTLKRLTAPRGRVWECSGVWGYNEQSLSIKCALLGIPILVSRDLFSLHLYRKDAHVPGQTRDWWNNRAETWQVLFRPETRGALDAIAAQHSSLTVADDIDRPWPVEREREFLAALEVGGN